MQVKKQNLKLGQPAIKWTVGALTAALMGAGIVSCGGGGSGANPALFPPGQTLTESAAQVTPVDCLDPTDETPGNTACNRYRLTRDEVRTVIAQGINAARSLNVNGVIAVVDRVGNVLAVYSTLADTVAVGTASPGGFPAGNITITGNRGVTTGLDGQVFNNTTAPLFAISKAITGAYLSSSGNAFSTRTASLIVQQNFFPGQLGAPGGPLFGVQFSQLPCGDLVFDIGQSATAGPKRSPLGLAADPGGFPLYKNGVVVGGVGFIKFGGTYSLDLDPTDNDSDDEEIVAWTAGSGFQAPENIRGNRIKADGASLIFTETGGIAANPTPPASVTELTVAGYKNAATPPNSNVSAGIPYGAPGSGYRPSNTAGFNDNLGGNLTARKAFVLANPDQSLRFPPSSAPNSSTAPLAGNRLAEGDVKTLLDKAYEIANRGRAQIRIPLDSAIQVTISVVDLDGNVRGVVRTPDAPIFGTDVSLQKARSALFMSRNLRAQVQAVADLNRYIDVAGFANITRFDGSIAFSARGFGNFARPFFPDGENSRGNGPFSRPFSEWSPFSTGMQLDLVAPAVLDNQSRITNPANPADPNNRALTCAPNGLPARNGLQIFAGGFPLYNAQGALVGGIGISGDGIDQDDMIAFLGIENARIAGANVRHPLPADAPGRPATEPQRNDNFSFASGGVQVQGRYVNCPPKPFTDSDEQNVCRGI